VTSPAPRRPPVLLTVHAVVVLALGVLLVVVASQETPDANIGAGLALLAVLPFGAPWSALALLGPDTWSGATQVAIALGAAVLNVVLHALLRAHLRRRRAGSRVAPATVDRTAP
jgi:drug/metabolite transporter (DMT)-like permease